MSTCTITGTVHHSHNDAPWIGGVVLFHLDRTFTANGVIYEPQSFDATLDSDGAFSVPLPKPSSIDVIAYYHCTLPSGTVVQFSISSTDTARTLAEMV